MLRLKGLTALSVAIFSLAGIGAVHATTWSDIQNAINTTCNTGGTVTIPATMPAITSTLNLKCAAGSIPVALQGSPTLVTCSTGAAPCIEVGSTGAGSRTYLSIRDINLNGPGWGTVGSTGIHLLPTADSFRGSSIDIENFETGLLLSGEPALLGNDIFDKLVVGGNGALVQVAIHLQDEVANAYFSDFGLSARQRLILDDGRGGSGASASFSHGYFNPTLTPGTAGVYVTSSDGSYHSLLIANIQDWETACPYAEVGDAGRITINGVLWNGDGHGNSAFPAFKFDTTGQISVSDALIGPCGGSTVQPLAVMNSSNQAFKVSNSVLYGTVQFNGSGGATFVGNSWLGFSSGASTCTTGAFFVLRSSANVNCADH
jgi:hypothetical protein